MMNYSKRGSQGMKGFPTKQNSLQEKCSKLMPGRPFLPLEKNPETKLHNNQMYADGLSSTLHLSTHQILQLRQDLARVTNQKLLISGRMKKS
jgi:hypothetical protein